MKNLKPAAFLDRDGTINVEKGYLYRIEDFTYLEGAVDGLRQLQKWGYTLVIITNQSGIARGYYSENEFHRLMDWLVSDLGKKGIKIDGIYYCPHHPEGKIKTYRKSCNCRKPKTGLFEQAVKELGIDLSQSIAIGDKPGDLEICRTSGVKGILLGDRKEKVEWEVVCKDWEEAINSIRKWRKSKIDATRSGGRIT